MVVRVKFSHQKGIKMAKNSQEMSKLGIFDQKKLKIDIFGGRSKNGFFSKKIFLGHPDTFFDPKPLGNLKKVNFFVFRVAPLTVLDLNKGGK